MAREVLLVIVGAGASHDCTIDDGRTELVSPPEPSPLPEVHFRDATPPLTKDLVATNHLYGSLIDRYKPAQPVISHLRDVLGAGDSSAPSLEEALGRYEQRGNPQVQRHLMGFRFYLRDLTIACSEYVRSPALGAGITHYTPLVTQLHDWACAGGNRRVCFVSFNYDIILDRACEAVWGLDPFDLDTYCSDPHASLIKPHGSAVWGRKVMSGDNAVTTPVGQQFDTLMAHVAAWDNQLEPYLNKTVEGDRNAIPRQSDSRERLPIVVPEIALPLLGKDSLLPPGQSEHLKGLGRDVSRVLTVGWRAAEDHFMGKLADVLAPGYKLLVVTGGNAAGVEAEQVRGRFHEVREHPTQRDRIRPEGFADFMRQQSGRENLAWLLEPDA